MITFLRNDPDQGFRQIIAVHEASHAVVHYFFDGLQGIDLVTIDSQRATALMGSPCRGCVHFFSTDLTGHPVSTPEGFDFWVRTTACRLAPDHFVARFTGKEVPFPEDHRQALQEFALHSGTRRLDRYREVEVHALALLTLKSAQFYPHVLTLAEALLTHTTLTRPQIIDILQPYTS